MKTLPKLRRFLRKYLKTFYVNPYKSLLAFISPQNSFRKITFTNQIRTTSEIILKISSRIIAPGSDHLIKTFQRKIHKSNTLLQYRLENNKNMTQKRKSWSSPEPVFIKTRCPDNTTNEIFLSITTETPLTCLIERPYSLTKSNNFSSLINFPYCINVNQGLLRYKFLTSPLNSFT